MSTLSLHPRRRSLEESEGQLSLHPRSEELAKARASELEPTNQPLVQPAPDSPKGFDERFPNLSRALDVFAPVGQRAAAVGEQVSQAVKDIPKAIIERRAEGMTGADPYAETLQLVNRSLQRGGRETKNLAMILFSPFSLLLSPAEPLITPVVGTITNLLKGVSTLDPGQLQINPAMADRPFIEVLSTPGAVRTQNENLNALLDEAGGVLPFVLAGGAAGRARVSQFKPFEPTPADLAALREIPKTVEQAEAPPVARPTPPTPQAPPPVLYTPERLQKMAAEDAALRADQTIAEAPAKRPATFEEPAITEHLSTAAELALRGETAPKVRTGEPVAIGSLRPESFKLSPEARDLLRNQKSLEVQLRQLLSDVERAKEAEARASEGAPYRVVDRRRTVQETMKEAAKEVIREELGIEKAGARQALTQIAPPEAPTPRPEAGTPKEVPKVAQVSERSPETMPMAEISKVGEKLPEVEAQRVSTQRPTAELRERERVSGVEGAEGKLKTATQDIGAKYRVVEADSLRTSHDAATFAENPDYPTGVQERAYHLSKEAQNRVIQQTQRFDPSFVINSNPDAVNGPPIITPDGTVLGGNSRAMTINRLYSEGQGDRYKPQLFQEARNFGVDANAVNAMRRPILVRELNQPVRTVEEARRIASDLNRSFTGALGINEKAVSAGRSITQGTLEEVGTLLDDLGEGASLRDLLRERPKPVIEALVRDRVITERERPQYVDPTTGGLSEAGKDFIERALLGSVVDDVRLLETAPKSVLIKVESSLADLSRLKSRHDEWDITPLIRSALRAHSEIAARGSNVETQLAQAGMFGGPRNPVVDALVGALAGKPREVRAAIRGFAADARQDVQGQVVLGLFEKPEASRSFNDAFGSRITREEYIGGLTRAVEEEAHARARRGETETAPSAARPIEGRGDRGNEPQAEPTGEPGAAREPSEPATGQTPSRDVTLSANPVFSSGFWAKADAAVRPLTLKIDRAIERTIGSLPFSIRKWLREDPRAKEIIQEARAEVGQRRSETEAVLRMVLRAKPTREETVIADRIARGVPQDLSPAREPLRGAIQKAAENAHALAQQMTSERSALGLPIREEWIEGPKHWYPNLWKQHLFSARMIAGRLFGMLRRGAGPLKPSAAEMGSLRARTTDRWVVVNNTGEIVKLPSGLQAVYDAPNKAEAFVTANSGYKLRYFEKGSRGLRERTFSSIAARTEWVKDQGEAISVREMLPGRHLRIVEPMTHEQAVAHGLIEDLTLNLRFGFGKEWSLIAKTRALERIGRDLAVDLPQPGYVRLAGVGFEVPPKLAERNPYIGRLKDGFVPESVAETLAAFYGRRGVWETRFRIAEGILRKWVTVFSPFRHPRNIIENEIALSFGDPKAALNVPAMAESFRDFARGARGEKAPYWDEYQRSGLALTDILAGEFQTIWRGIDAVKPGTSPLSLTERLALWAETNPAASRLLRTRDFVEHLYRAEDQVWKYYFYRTLRERGWEPEAAAYRTRRTFFDYEDVPPIIAAANRYVPFIANITYQYSRILGTALRDRPASSAMKIALLLYGYAFMRDELMKRAGITERDEKNMGKLGLRPWEFPLPMTDSKGRNLVVNLQWAVPFSEVGLLRYAATEEEPETGLAQTTRRFIPMVAQPAATVISQRGAFGQKVLTGTETSKEAKRKIAREAVLAALPGLLGQYWDRLYRNASAGEEKREPWSQVLAEGFAGNIQRIRPQERIELRKALMGGKGREIQEEASRQRGRVIRGQITGEKFQEEVGRLRARSGEPNVAHPETLEVVKALEEGRHAEARTAFQKLKQSGFYGSEDEALKAVRDLVSRRARLGELETAPLPEARTSAQALIDDFRRTGRVSNDRRRALQAALATLSESDQDALLDWLEVQMRVAREERQRAKPKTPTATSPRYSGPGLKLPPRQLGLSP